MRAICGGGGQRGRQRNERYYGLASTVTAYMDKNLMLQTRTQYIPEKVTSDRVRVVVKDDCAQA